MLKQTLDNVGLGETHQVENVAQVLQNYNLFTGDHALAEAVVREGGEWGLADIENFGEKLGTEAVLELGYLANKFKPELETHDRFGNRIDQVNYHEAYHQLMSLASGAGLHSDVWTDPKVGSHVVRGAKNLLITQVESGHGCPMTMTFAAIPSIRMQPELAAMFENKILSTQYDPRNVPFTQKDSLTVGMGMTEKQGGSDVRANSTRATAVEKSGPGELYSLVGHKWFLSAPMCDLFLILAQTDKGVSCFLVPRWLESGDKNALNVIRLKDKMGNCSNASSEVEFRGAQGWLLGEEGRGVPTIIEMVSLTRFDCMVGSAGLMRAGLANAIHHCRHREAFGAPLLQKPLMRNLLADLALEYEGAVAIAMRMAHALDHKELDRDEANLARLVTAIGKYWVCKRVPEHSYEVMEVIDGSGVMENSIYPRLFRESVINTIWEGSGNVQCLDVLRAVAKNPAVIQSYLKEVALANGINPVFDASLAKLQQKLLELDPRDGDAMEFQARQLVEDMALVFQASLLVRNAPSAVSEAFCATRLAATGYGNYGRLPLGVDVETIIARADPLLAWQVMAEAPEHKQAG